MSSRVAIWAGAASFAMLSMVSSAMAYQGLTAGAATMRSGPGPKYKVVMSVPPGAMIDVQSCTPNWCRVSWRYRVGYIPAATVEGPDGEYDGPVYGGPPPVYVEPPVILDPYPYWGPGWGWGGGGRGWRR